MESLLARNIDRWNRQLRRESRKEGRKEGRQEGAAGLLLRQLRRKLGPLSPEIEERVRSADFRRLERWSERILTAESLEDVFGEQGSSDTSHPGQ